MIEHTPSAAGTAALFVWLVVQEERRLAAGRLA